MKFFFVLFLVLSLSSCDSSKVNSAYIDHELRNNLVKQLIIKSFEDSGIPYQDVGKNKIRYSAEYSETVKSIQNQIHQNLTAVREVHFDDKAYLESFIRILEREKIKNLRNTENKKIIYVFVEKDFDLESIQIEAFDNLIR